MYLDLLGLMKFYIVYIELTPLLETPLSEFSLRPRFILQENKA
jgi:hypothetical protein